MNIERLAAILRDAAKAEILPRFRQLGDDDIRSKSGAFDLVTEADEAAERAITAAINAHSPLHVVVGEEAVAANPALLEANFGDRVVIYVDPVDGTYNFAAGLSLFAVMAGVVQNGETVAGVIYDPLGDDWVMAERGCGAWHVTPAGHRRRLKFAAPVAIAEMGGSASVAFLQGAQRAEILGNLAKVQSLAAYRCAGQEYRAAASGFLHFLMYSKLMPWDHVAGALIAQEAGACVARFDGSAYLPSHRAGGLIVAPDQDSWQALRREVFTF